MCPLLMDTSNRENNLLEEKGRYSAGLHLADQFCRRDMVQSKTKERPCTFRGKYLDLRNIRALNQLFFGSDLLKLVI